MLNNVCIGKVINIMKKIYKERCPICGNYTVMDIGDICPVCFWEMGLLDGKDDKIKAISNYKKFGVSNISCDEFIRKPRGIELQGFYEPFDVEAIEDPQYIYTRNCLNNKEDLFLKAKNVLFNHSSEISEKEAFDIFNALAYSDGCIGYDSTINLALCYTQGIGCKKDVAEAQDVLLNILNYYEVKSNEDILYY